LSASIWLKQNFKKTKEGYMVYKVFGNTCFNSPNSWKIKTGCIITEITNPCRTIECGCGVNFATLDWIKKHYRNKKIEVRRCIIKWSDLPGVIVPYNTDGKARCEKLKIGKVIEV